MEDVSLGKLLPNIKITVPSFPEVLIPDNTDVEPEQSTIANSSAIRPNITGLEYVNPKAYLNKVDTFATGLDLSSQENVKMLDKRAVRFGLDESECAKETIPSLYKSMGIPIEALQEDIPKLKNLRLDTLHMRGVEELDNEDIMDYFKLYIAKRVQWINDISCNVVFVDKMTSARALIGLSLPIDTVYPSTVSKPPNPDSYDDADIASDKKMDEDMEIEGSDADAVAPKPTVPPNPNLVLNVPVPPGVWRLGKKHPKAKTILLRFATTADKKLPGAEKRSMFYLKNGNPNHGGLKGLISSSRKKREAAAANKNFIEKSSARNSTSQRSEVNHSKPLRMRMYADEEELKRKKARFDDTVPSKSSVKSRLGLKYTKEDLKSLGSQDRNESSYHENSVYSRKYDRDEASYQARNHQRSASRDRDRDRETSVYSRKYPRSAARVPSGMDLRDKLKNKKFDSEEKRVRSVYSKITGNNSKTQYKRKYRSPLCEDDEEDDEDYESSSSG